MSQTFSLQLILWCYLFAADVQSLTWGGNSCAFMVPPCFSSLPCQLHLVEDSWHGFVLSIELSGQDLSYSLMVLIFCTLLCLLIVVAVWLRNTNVLVASLYVRCMFWWQATLFTTFSWSDFSNPKDITLFRCRSVLDAWASFHSPIKFSVKVFKILLTL